MDDTNSNTDTVLLCLLEFTIIGISFNLKVFEKNSKHISGLRQAKQNGWWLFYRDESSRRLALAGESPKDCSTRIWNECKERWNQGGSAQVELRRKWSLAAKEINKMAKDQRNSELCPIDAAPADQVENEEQITQVDDDGLVLCPYLQVSHEGSGVLGLGDESFPLAVQTVAEYDAAHKGFVKTFAAKWRTRTHAQFSTDGINIPSGSTQLSCYETFGFCQQGLNGIEESFRMAQAWLIKHVADHRKNHLVNGKNKGPSAQIPHPLLLIKYLSRWIFLGQCTLGINHITKLKHKNIIVSMWFRNLCWR